jgi:hypothetical protein
MEEWLASMIEVLSHRAPQHLHWPAANKYGRLQRWKM